jgi:hypothetical protein
MLAAVRDRLEQSPAYWNARYRLKGQSYWAARFRDGTEVYEWQVDWSLLPRRGLIEVRLHCPNGQVGVLGNTLDLSDRAFQYKEAELRISMPLKGLAEVITGKPKSRRVSKHVIGMLTGPNGEAVVWWWDYALRRLLGPLPTTVEPGQVGILGNVASHLAFDVLGAKPD